MSAVEDPALPGEPPAAIPPAPIPAEAPVPPAAPTMSDIRDQFTPPPAVDAVFDDKGAGGPARDGVPIVS